MFKLKPNSKFVYTKLIVLLFFCILQIQTHPLRADSLSPDSLRADILPLETSSFHAGELNPGQLKLGQLNTAQLKTESLDSSYNQSQKEDTSWVKQISQLAAVNKVLLMLNNIGEQFSLLEVQLEGVNKLTRQEIERILPENQNLLSWKLMEDDIKARFLAHPLVADLSFEKCISNQGYKCLKLKITEQKPRLWVKASANNGFDNFLINSFSDLSIKADGEKSGWEKTGSEKIIENKYLIAADGKILAAIKQGHRIEPFTDQDAQLLAKFSIAELSDLPILDVRNFAIVSDASTRMFSKAVDVLNMIESTFGQKVYQIKFLSDSEIEADFELQPYTLVFDLGEDFSDRSLLLAQIERLNKVLQEKPILASRASKITLGLNKEVVVLLS